ncbi:hypothetical protein ACYRFS_02215 [Listeria kieliensis]
MKPLKKWKDSLNSVENLDTTNENIDKINNFIVSDAEQKDELRKMITNLILNTDKGNKNEVTDARFSKLQNEIYDTLGDRINTDINYVANAISAVLERLLNVENTNKEVLKMLRKLYGLDSGTIEIYVNAATGNDSTGDGTFVKPYRTINKATHDIPRFLDGNDAHVYVSPGTYDEDVSFPRISGGRIFLEAIHFDTIDVMKGTGVQVRSILAEDLYYIEIRGFEELAAYKSHPGHFIRIDSCTRAYLRKIRFTTNLRNQEDLYGLIANGAMMVWLIECRWAYQSVDIRSQYGSNVIIDTECSHGGKSSIGLMAQMGKIYNRLPNKLNWEADIPTKAFPGAEFITRT